MNVYSMCILGMEFCSLGLHSKCFYLLSHLAGFYFERLSTHVYLESDSIMLLWPLTTFEIAWCKAEVPGLAVILIPMLSFCLHPLSLSELTCVDLIAT